MLHYLWNRETRFLESKATHAFGKPQRTSFTAIAWSHRRKRNIWKFFFEKSPCSLFTESVHLLTHKRENYAEHHFMHCRGRRPRLSVYKIFVEQTGRRGRRPLRKSKKLTPNHLHQTPRKCECFTSIFLEMTALASFFTSQNSLVLLSEFSASRSVLPRAFFLLSFPKERKKDADIIRECI